MSGPEQVVDQMIEDLGVAGVAAVKDPGVVRAIVGGNGYCVLIEPPDQGAMMHDGYTFSVDLDVRIVVKPPGGWPELRPGYAVLGAVQRATGGVQSRREIYQSSELNLPSIVVTATRTYTEE